LASLLHTLGIQNLIVVGFVADCCILFTLADAVFRGYHTVLLRDCTLAVEWDEEIKSFSNTQRTVKWIESIIGPSALSKDFIEALKKPV
jgi:nicotinamidase-related amidase